MNQQNRYAPPKAHVADVADVRDANCTRDGKFVIVPRGNDLPARCIVCNAPVTTPIKSRKLYWHSPWLYLLILLRVLPYLIVALIVRKKFVVSPGLCEQHAAIRRKRLMVLVPLALAGLVVGPVMFVKDHHAIGGVFFAVALAALVAASYAARTVYPKKITKEYARLSGCKEPFLASLE